MPVEPSDSNSMDKVKETTLVITYSGDDAVTISESSLSRPSIEISNPFMCHETLPLQSALPTTAAANDVVETQKPNKSRGAFELKFLIDELQALDIMAWARTHLDPDPHADPELGDGYRVNSLYLDTPLFDVFHRGEGFRQQKFRLRRYGRESLVWLEEKRKRKSFVRKRRIAVRDSDVSTRFNQPPEVQWDGHWFRHKVDKWNLRPICQITYHRFARLKSTEEGPIRMTIDDQLVAGPASGWQVPTSSLTGDSLLNGKRIVELKFRGAMPVSFRKLIEEQKLQVTSFSKYRTSLEKYPSLRTVLGHNAGGLSDG